MILDSHNVVFYYPKYGYSLNCVCWKFKISAENFILVMEQLFIDYAIK